MSSWTDERKNVRHVGCFADTAKRHPTLANEAYYQVQIQPGPGEVLPQPPDYVNVLRREPQYRYRNWADGPTRVAASLEDPETLLQEKVDPRSLPVDQALSRCYRKALQYGHKYFALQDGGLCFGSSNLAQIQQWGAVTGAKACQPCETVCSTHYKPCGADCVHESVPCRQRLHHACHATEAVFREQHPHPFREPVGGAYVNSVYEIVRPDWEPPDLSENPDFAYRAPIVGQGWDCQQQNFFPLSPSQLFHQQLLTPRFPGKGLLNYGSTGSGKSCLALNVAQNFLNEGWSVFWVTRRALFQIPMYEAYQNICIQQLRELIMRPENEPWLDAKGEAFPNTSTVSERIAFVRNPANRAWLKGPPFNLKIHANRRITYEQLVQMILGYRKTEQGRNEAASQELRELWNQQQQNRFRDPGYRTLFIIDEAHNMVLANPLEAPSLSHALHGGLRIGSKLYQSTEDLGVLPSAPLTGKDAFAALLDYSYATSKADSAKVLLLTATPMLDSPLELFQLLNLLQPDPSTKLSLRLSDYYDGQTRQLKPEALRKLQRACHGTVSYLNASHDASKYARRMLSSVHLVPLLPFHMTRLNQRIQEARGDSSLIRQAFYDTELALQTHGLVFDGPTLQKVRRGLSIAPSGVNVQSLVQQAREQYRRQQEFPNQAAVLPQERERAAAKLRQRYRRAKLAYLAHRMKQPQAPPQGHAAEVTGHDGRLLTFHEWKQLLPPERAVAQQPLKNLTEGEFVTQFLAAHARDPARNKNEGVSYEPASVSFIWRHRKFKPAYFRAHMDVYAPLLKALVLKVLQSVTEPTKAHERHAVLTFSTFDRAHKYGSDIVASAFAVYPEHFYVLSMYRREQLPDVDEDDKPLVDKATGQVIMTTRTWLDDSDLPPGRVPVVIFTDHAYRPTTAQEVGVNQTVGDNLATQEANTQYVNQANKQNKPLVVVLDGAFREGMSLFNIHHTHMLGLGETQALTQFLSRPTRNCRSTLLPFWPQLGGLMQVHLYVATDPSGKTTLYKHFLQTKNPEERIAHELIEKFEELVARYSIDYNLNRHLYHSRETFDGVIEHTQRVSAGTSIQGYWVRLPATYGAPIVFVDDVDLVSREADGKHVRFRLSPAETHITRMFIRPDSLQKLEPPAPAYHGDVVLPSVAAQLSRSTFRNNPVNALLGLLFLKQNTQYRLVTSYKANQSCFGASNYDQWTLVWQTATLELQPKSLLEELVKDPKQPSLLVVALLRVGGQPQGQPAKTQLPGQTSALLNYLLWFPQTQTLERVDPDPERSAYFASTLLDSTLCHFCEARKLRYQSPPWTLAMLPPLKPHESNPELQALALLYTHTRLAQHGVGRSPEEHLGQLQASLSKAGSLMYLRHYSTQLFNLWKEVNQEVTYRTDLPIWCNLLEKLYPSKYTKVLPLEYREGEALWNQLVAPLRVVAKKPGVVKVKQRANLNPPEAKPRRKAKIAKEDL